MKFKQNRLGRIINLPSLSNGKSRLYQAYELV